jgi:hypothetical protein
MQAFQRTRSPVETRPAIARIGYTNFAQRRGESDRTIAREARRRRQGRDLDTARSTVLAPGSGSTGSRVTRIAVLAIIAYILWRTLALKFSSRRLYTGSAVLARTRGT